MASINKIANWLSMFTTIFAIWLQVEMKAIWASHQHPICLEWNGIMNWPMLRKCTPINASLPTIAILAVEQVKHFFYNSIQFILSNHWYVFLNVIFLFPLLKFQWIHLVWWEVQIPFANFHFKSLFSSCFFGSVQIVIIKCFLVSGKCQFQTWWNSISLFNLNFIPLNFVFVFIQNGITWWFEYDANKYFKFKFMFFIQTYLPSTY